MELALKKAEEALERGDYPAGCVVVKNGKVVGEGSSSGRSKKDPTAHGEMIAIKDACKELGKRFLEGCTVYTTVEPCLMCGKAMVYARIDKVIYGTEHGEYDGKKTFDILKENDIGKNIEVVSGFMSENALKLMDKFFKDNPDFEV